MLDFSRSVSRGGLQILARPNAGNNGSSHGELRKGGRDVEDEFEGVKTLEVARGFLDLFLWWVYVDVSPEAILQF